MVSAGDGHSSLSRLFGTRQHHKQDVAHFARSVPLEDVAANGYNLSVSSYVEAKDTREVVDISQLNAELKTTVARIDQLRREIDAIVAEIEGEEAGA